MAIQKFRCYPAIRSKAGNIRSVRQAVGTFPVGCFFPFGNQSTFDVIEVNTADRIHRNTAQCYYTAQLFAIGIDLCLRTAAFFHNVGNFAVQSHEVDLMNERI